MKVANKYYKTVRMDSNGSIFLIEQNKLPFHFEIIECKNYQDTCEAIKTMIVRGAGAIGVTAGFAMAQAILQSPDKDALKFVQKAKKEIESTRPTAQNLFFATNRVYNTYIKSKEESILEAHKIAQEDEDNCKKIGILGNTLIETKNNILTHCNAGWLAFVDYGSALSPIYKARDTGKDIFVFVDETRPRSQGARLTAWELKNENIKHQIISDNAVAYLMANKKIDMVIVGADRITKKGDIANKIGTLEKAILANYYNIPFYVTAPSSTIDWKCEDAQKIPIEIRSQDEILYQTGINEAGKLEKILVCSPDSSAFNPAFDVTPAKLISKIITENGIYNPEDIEKLEGKF